MKKVVKKAISKALGMAGDGMDERGCPLIVYQPKACKRVKK